MSVNPNEVPESFGVTITPRPPGEVALYWRVRRVRVLSGAENTRNHHIYVDAYDIDGSPYRKLNFMVEYMYGNTASRLVNMDKPANEPGGNEPMYMNQVYSVSMYSVALSEKVEGMHTKHADDGSGGNTMGHWSFHIEFQLTPTTPPAPTPGPGPTVPPTPTPTPTDTLCEEELANLKMSLRDIRASVRAAKLALEGAERTIDSLFIDS